MCAAARTVLHDALDDVFARLIVKELLLPFGRDEGDRLEQHRNVLLRKVAIVVKVVEAEGGLGLHLRTRHVARCDVRCQGGRNLRKVGV